MPRPFKSPWSKRSKVERERDPNRPRPPPGLRGREIGLFYRDLGRQRAKAEGSEHYVNFSIPAPVLASVRARLFSLYDTAEKHGITVAIGQKLDIPDKSKLPQNPDFVGTDTTAPIETDDFIPLFNKNKVDSEKRVKESSPKQIKLEKHEFKIPEPPKARPSTSQMEDFIPIKQEPLDIESPMGRLLSLRGNTEFKYSYKDIITGTFQEKLDESLNKGIEITKTNPDIDQLNESLYKDYVKMVNSPKYNKMMEFRSKLPAYKKSDEILSTIKNNQVVVISGETGCGKSTQVPQIILDDALRRNEGAFVKIMVTQPRRIAASSLAERVAEERAERMGNSTGYAVRLEKVDPRARGSIMFVTTGIMLADLEVNQGLTNVSHVILDEVHERDVHVDLTMCMLKEVLQKRKDLKLILMSATLDADRLTSYFNNCPKLHIEGLAYPVKDIYLEEILHKTRFKPKDKENWKSRKTSAKEMEKMIQYRAGVGPWLESVKKSLDRDVYQTLQDPASEELQVELVLEVIWHISKGEPGAILVFLPGISEITKLLRLMSESNSFPKSQYDIYPLHSKLPSLEQKRIFERPPQGVRKIIIATNIAETSITIDDIVYVVDSGKVKMSGFDVDSNFATLSVEWISQANLRQRRGRAGRCQPGVCYHLLTTYRASQLEERTLPELQRSNLLEPVLMVKKLRLGKAEDAFQMVMDPPVMSTVRWAVKHLQQVGALNESEVLTPLGWHLARLPLHPAAGKLLLLGALFGCLNRAACVAAVWGFKDPFMMVIGKEKEVDQAKKDLALNEPSDHIAISEAIMQWENMGHQQRRNFAYDYFLSNSTMQLLIEMKNQLGDNLKQMGFLADGDVRSGWENRNLENLSLFKAIVAASLYPNVGKVRWSGQGFRKNHNKPRTSRPCVRTAEDGKVELHPSSVLAVKHGSSGSSYSSMGNWLVFWLKQKSSQLFLLEATVVYTLPLLFFGELVVSDVPESPLECSMTVASFKVRCLKETAQILLHLRALLDQVLASKVTQTHEHAVTHSEFEEEVLNAVKELITAEDEQMESADDDSQSESDVSDSEHSQTSGRGGRGWRGGGGGGGRGRWGRGQRWR